MLPDWTGRLVLIMGAGPSAAREALDALPSHLVQFPVNASFRLSARPSALHACDAAFWREYPAALLTLCPKFGHDQQELPAGVTGIRIRQDLDFSDEPLTVGGTNSGQHAINLAYHFGARRIILIGFDMSETGPVHWHGEHPAGMNNPRKHNFEAWRASLGKMAATLRDHGVEVINASRTTALDAFPRASLYEAAAHFRTDTPARARRG